jgi:hypothetical protein
VGSSVSVGHTAFILTVDDRNVGVNLPSYAASSRITPSSTQPSDFSTTKQLYTLYITVGILKLAVVYSLFVNEIHEFCGAYVLHIVVTQTGL